MDQQSKAALSILLICSEFKPSLGGEAELAYQLALAIDEQENKLSVLAPPCDQEVAEDHKLSNTPIRELDVAAFPPLQRIKGWLYWPFAMIKMIRTMKKVVKAKKTNVILITSYHSWVTMAVRALNIPYALFLHGEDLTLTFARGPIHRWICARACRDAKHIFFNSHYSREQIAQISPSFLKKSESIGCGVNQKIHWTTKERAAARKQLGWEDELVIITVARLIMRKGLATVIEALPLIHQYAPNCRYVIVGDGPDRTTLEKLICKLQLDKNVLFTGRIDNEEKERLYAAADIYAMVSHPGKRNEVEGFGITFLEANLHGLPAIGSRCGGIPDAVEDGVNGLLVEPNSPGEVAAAVQRLASDSALRHQMAQQGQRRIREKFNWTTIASRVVRQLNNIAMRPNHE